ncbi:MAG: conjugal transfer protein TraS, partial [Acidovorax sp.]|nr:conjugal transfer protein TraS [Acidovorax sp.]
MLITWGDRLFYPGNRIVQVKPQPKLGASGAHQRANAIRQRIEATVVRRAPHVFVKLTGGGGSMAAIAALFRYF